MSVPRDLPTGASAPNSSYCDTRLRADRRYIASDHEVEKSKEKVRGYLATLNKKCARGILAGDIFFSGYYLHPVLLRLAALPNEIGRRSAAPESLDATVCSDRRPCERHREFVVLLDGRESNQSLVSNREFNNYR